MLQFNQNKLRIVGPSGELPVKPGDEVTRKLAMLVEGECQGLGARKAAEKHGYTRQRYSQILCAYREKGAEALKNQKRGPKTNYRRGEEVVRQVIRHRFLDPDASAEVIAQKLRQCGWEISRSSVERVITQYGLQKKLHAFRPNNEPLFVETRRTKKQRRQEPSDPGSIERGVRQLLAQKISGTMVGIWLLAAEHLRLGTWDLLCAWTGRGAERVEPRLAMQLVHESALCMTRVRKGQSLSQKGFEAANGLPFVATDQAIHALLESQTVRRTEQLQIALGRLRRASGHFSGRLLAVDPHHLRSWTKRQMRRHRHKETEKPFKSLQTFFCLDAETRQPVAFTIGSAAKTVSQATPELLDMTRAILNPDPLEKPLVLADNEHLTAGIFEYVNAAGSPFDLLCPMPRGQATQRKMAALPQDLFKPRWAGMATARRPYQFQNSPTQPLYQIIQRCGENPTNYHYSPFLSTSRRDELEQVCDDYPDRWHAEEFFNSYQAMGWNRAGTLNLQIRYAQLTMALIAQAVVHQFRRRLGDPYDKWEADHLGKHVFQGLDGDVRVAGDTIVVTYYNAPNVEKLRRHYEGLPRKLESENIDPHVPWLYDFKLDFRFK